MKDKTESTRPRPPTYTAFLRQLDDDTFIVVSLQRVSIPAGNRNLEPLRTKTKLKR